MTKTRGSKWRFRFRACWLGLVILLVSLFPVSAHMPVMATATATIAADGTYSMDLTFDVPPFVLKVSPANANDPAMNAWLDGPTNLVATTLREAQGRFQREFAVLADGVAAPVDSLIFPTVDDIERYRDAAPPVRLPAMLMLSLEGRVPAGARSFSVRFPAEMGVVALNVNRPDEPPATLVANAGEASTPLPLKLAGAGGTNANAAQANAAPVPEPTRWLVFRQYLVLGFQHIVPEGTDHILFVLGLFLLGNRWKPLLLQVTAFTVAHSITLGLSMYGIFRLPSTIVEPLIALSIALVAVENICTPELKPWRPFVVFAFGLMHGLGFSSVLNSLGLPRNDFATALVAFNSGVELGQLTVIMGAFLLVGWWRKRSWYRQRVVIPGSVLIAATGLFWTIQRIVLALHPAT